MSKYLVVIILFLSHCTFAGGSPFHGVLWDSVPKPHLVEYKKLKNLYLKTELVTAAKPTVAIYAPGQYASLGSKIQLAIKQATGTSVELLTERQDVNLPANQNLIVLGNRSTNNVISTLYDRGFTYLDMKYPGKKGYVVRSLHNPHGNGRNVIFAGGSDLYGVSRAVDTLIGIISAVRKTGTGYSLDYICSIGLGEGYVLPENAKDAEIWEASTQYSSTGYFGWNSVSKYMALFYMTNEEKYLEEFLRLAFPDTAAIREMELMDGELIENKKDPLSGPYHYGAYMMICLWDLIEEHPALTDELRLKITNALARQLTHRVTEYGSIYYNKKAPEYIGDRHDDWAALSLYVLALYFQRDYPSDVWDYCVKSADLHFSSIQHTSWTAGNNDHLFWFTTFYDPMINYFVISGNREPQRLKNLRNALKSQEIIYTGNTVDWGLRTSSASMLNKAAYLLNDGRWLYLRDRNGIDTDVFRLGQSFWPDAELKTVAPDDLVGKWTIQWMPKEMWNKRRSAIPLENAFRWGSYRSAFNEAGDYLLIKGYNGAGRNPYHSLALLELRLNGSTVLKGYLNQVFTSADGLVEPRVAMDAALKFAAGTGETVLAQAEVPDLPFTSWKRSILIRKNKFAIIADELEFRANKANFLVETNWQTDTPAIKEGNSFLKIDPSSDATKKDKRFYAIHSSERMEVIPGKITKMNWRGTVKKGESKTLFHLIAPVPKDGDSILTCRMINDQAGIFSLPEPGIFVIGNYKNITAELMLLEAGSLYGKDLLSVGFERPLLKASHPVVIDWNFKTGVMSIENNRPVQLLVKVNASSLVLDNKPYTAETKDHLTLIRLDSGTHIVSNAIPSLQTLTELSTGLSQELKLSAYAHSDKLSGPVKNSKRSAASFKEVINMGVGSYPAQSVVLPSATGDLLCIASDDKVTILNSDGKKTREIKLNAKVMSLRWWTEHKLLLVGCLDEKVTAFDEYGNKKWEFISEMDPAVYEAGKQYWFKSAYPGIHGLFSGVFDHGKSRAFIGGSCTLEIIDENGKLIKRLPVFWSVIRQFLMINEPDGKNKLLVGGWQTGTNDLVVIGSHEMAETGRGYDQVPKGHSFVGGWMNMNRFDNYLVDLDNDGNRELVSAINGVWNRITVYSQKGEPLYNCQIGPGKTEPRSTIRMMDVGDINNDKKSEIIAALSSGYIDVLDDKAGKVWSMYMSSPPAAVKLIREDNLNWICAGLEDGSVMALDQSGKEFARTTIAGKPVDLQVLHSEAGIVVVVISDCGAVKGIRIPHAGKTVQKKSLFKQK